MSTTKLHKLPSSTDPFLLAYDTRIRYFFIQVDLQFASFKASTGDLTRDHLHRIQSVNYLLKQELLYLKVLLQVSLF